MTPADLVLRSMRTQPERWTIVPHRNDHDDLYKIAVEIIERLLPARYNALPTIAGRPLPPDKFPLTMSFIVRAAAVFGVRLGQKRAYQVRHLALTLLQREGNWPRRSRFSLTVFTVRGNTVTHNSSTTPLSPATRLDFLSAKQRLSTPTGTIRTGTRLLIRTIGELEIP